MDQLVTQLVCQFCGRTTMRAGAKFWLNEPHRFDDSVYVVRCPEHWSEWALRHTKAGRTEEMRARMREALSQPSPSIPPWLDPFPMMNHFE